MTLPAHVDRRVPLTPAEFVDATLAELAGHRGLAAITVPAPAAPLEALLRAAGSESGFLWDPPAGAGFSGFGSTVALQCTGRERIESLKQRAQAVWADLICAHHPDAPPVAVRLFGGFAFEHGASAAPWCDFGDSRFILPTWCYGRNGDRAWLTLAINPAATAATPGQRRHWQRELQRVLVMLETRASDSGTAAATASAMAPALVAMAEMPRAHWRRNIEDIRRAIAEARCDKIVAARCSVVEFAADIDPISVLRRLAQRHPDCYRFGYHFGAATFVGATPERLIARTGERVFAEALAGSIAAPRAGAESAPRATANVAMNPAERVAPSPGKAVAPSPSEAAQRAARTLLASGKDRGEQELVVRAIERVLRPLCVHLDVRPEPEIRVLRHVLHLETPIAGTLRAPTHILDLVAALHPTPAVGGEPTAAAMAWIADNEPEPRGWYAAPVGWFDAAGDGEFAVAIRSGLLAGHRAYLYAGAGIVRDSDPEAEFEETRLKQRAVLGALGVRT